MTWHNDCPLCRREIKHGILALGFLKDIPKGQGIQDVPKCWVAESSHYLIERNKNCEGLNCEGLPVTSLSLSFPTCQMGPLIILISVY